MEGRLLTVMISPICRRRAVLGRGLALVLVLALNMIFGLLRWMEFRRRGFRGRLTIRTVTFRLFTVRWWGYGLGCLRLLRRLSGGARYVTMVSIVGFTVSLRLGCRWMGRISGRIDCTRTLR